MYAPNDPLEVFGTLRRNVEQVESVRTFAIDFMRTLSSTFCMSDCSKTTSNMRDEMSVLLEGLKRKRPGPNEVAPAPTPVSEAVREARTILGKDNDVYLQVGISMLWTGESGEDQEYDTDYLDMHNTLFPSSIRSYGSMQQLSVDASALSLLRGRKEALEMRREHLYEEFQATLLPLMAYLLGMKEVRYYIVVHFGILSAKVDVAAAPKGDDEENTDTPATAINSEVTDAMRYTKEMLNILLDVETDDNISFKNILEKLKKQFQAAKTAKTTKGVSKFVMQLTTLIHMIEPLLQTEEAQKYGPLNMAMVNTCLCDAAANDRQFPPPALLNTDASQIVNKPLYRAAMHANLDISSQIEKLATADGVLFDNLQGSKDVSPQPLFSQYTPPKPTELPPPAMDGVFSPPFSPLTLEEDSKQGLTYMQLLPVYTCATRQLFSLPSPTQAYAIAENDSFKPYLWYALPGGQLSKLSSMRPSAREDIRRVYNEAPTQPTHLDDIIQHFNSLQDEADKFDIKLRMSVIESQILRNGMASKLLGHFDVTKKFFTKLPVVKTRWLPLQKGFVALENNQFDLKEDSRAACRATLLGALSTGAYAYFNDISNKEGLEDRRLYTLLNEQPAEARQETSPSIRFAALTKLHQLGPLLYIRSNRGKNDTWKRMGENYRVSLNIGGWQNDDFQMYTPLPPLYVRNDIVSYTSRPNQSNYEDIKDEWIGAKVYPFENETVKVEQYANTLRDKFEVEVEVDFKKDDDIQIRELESINHNIGENGDPSTLISQDALLKTMFERLQSLPYNDGLEKKLNVSYADDGRPLLRLIHNSLDANRRLLRQCERHEESIQLITNMLLETHDGLGGNAGDLGGLGGASGLSDDQMFYQGQAALQSQRQRGVPDAVERGRREAVWKDALRELTVSGDKLFIFLKTLAGLLHDDVTNIIKMEDRSMEQAQRVRAEQRREALRATMSFSQRSMDALMGAIFRQSNFRLDVDQSQDGSSQAKTMAGELVVVSEETVDRIRKLANETSNRSFFESQSQLTSFLEQSKGVSMPLQELVQGVRSIIRTQLTESLDMANRIDVHDERGAMDFLAQPRNSLIIRLKNETFAAIRQAYDALTVEMNAKGRRLQMQGISVYACVEGPSRQLCNQFAALSAYFMSQSRLFSSSASVYVSAQSASSNALMLRVALQKSVLRAIEYHQGRY